MKTIKLTIEYDGTNFNGWQVQPKKITRTVQGTLKDTLKKIVKHPITVIGSGRTDSGVHALGQVAHFKTRSEMTPLEFQKALNAKLPTDIAIIKAEEAANTFHAQFNAKCKTYQYTILNRPFRCARNKSFCSYYPYKLNVSAMKKEAAFLVGKHDFKSFTAADPRNPSRGKNTTRTIKKLEIKKKMDYITIDITATGFLYKMVRNIVGTLIEIGSGKLHGQNIKNILKAEDRAVAGPTASAKGLCLLEVKY